MHVEPCQVRQSTKRADVRDRILADDELPQVRESAQGADVTDPVGVQAEHSEVRELTQRADVREQPVENAQVGQI